MQKYIDYFIKTKKSVSLFSPHDSYNTDNTLIHKYLHGKYTFYTIPQLMPRKLKSRDFVPDCLNNFLLMELRILDTL